jgi:hypothetical protein
LWRGTDKTIARLEAENAELKKTQQPVKEIVVPNPLHKQELDKVTKRQDELIRQTVFLLEHVVSKEQTVLCACRELDRTAASEICEALGWHYNEVARFNQSYDFNAWSNIIEQAQTEGPLVKLARAAIALEVTDSPMDPVLAAKYQTGTLRMQTASEVAARNSLGRLNSSDI